MPDMWMDVDTALASVPVNKTPLVDSGTGIDIEDTVTYNQAGLALFWNFTTTAGVTTVTAVTPTTAGVYDWTDFTTSGMYGIEIPASGGASANNNAEGFGHFTGVATGILPWSGPVIGFRAAALNNALIDGGDVLDTNVTEWLGTAPATPTTNGIPEVDVNMWNGVALATTNPLPTVAAGAAGGLPDDTDANGRVRIVDGTAAGELDTASGAVTVGSIAANAITAASIATDAIGAAEIAADAIDLIWDEALSGHVGAGSFGKAVADIESDATLILADTGELQTNQGNWLTVTGHATEAKQDIIDTNIDQIEAAVITNAAGVDIAADIIAVKAETANILTDTAELQGDWVDGGRLDNLLDGASAPTAATVATAVWEELTATARTAGTYGQLHKDNIDAAITTAATATGFATNTKQDSMETTLNAAATAAALTTVDTEVGLIQADLDNATDGLGALKALIDALNDAPAVSVADILTTQMTEAYAADGTAPTLAQALMLIQQTLTQFAISGTSMSVKKLDGTTEAAVLTLDDATNPTSLDRTA